MFLNNYPSIKINLKWGRTGTQRDQHPSWWPMCRKERMWRGLAQPFPTYDTQFLPRGHWTGPQRMLQGWGWPGTRGWTQTGRGVWGDMSSSALLSVRWKSLEEEERQGQTWFSQYPWAALLGLQWKVNQDRRRVFGRLIEQPRWETAVLGSWVLFPSPPSSSADTLVASPLLPAQFSPLTPPFLLNIHPFHLFSWLPHQSASMVEHLLLHFLSRRLLLFLNIAHFLCPKDLVLLISIKHESTSLAQWTWVWANSESWWRTEKPGVLQFIRSQRVRHNLGTEQQK